MPRLPYDEMWICQGATLSKSVVHLSLIQLLRFNMSCTQQIFYTSLLYHTHLRTRQLCTSNMISSISSCSKMLTRHPVTTSPSVSESHLVCVSHCHLTSGTSCNGGSRQNVWNPLLQISQSSMSAASLLDPQT